MLQDQLLIFDKWQKSFINEKINGQLAPEIQKELISSLTNQDKKLIESK